MTFTPKHFSTVAISALIAGIVLLVFCLAQTVSLWKTRQTSDLEANHHAATLTGNACKKLDARFAELVTLAEQNAADLCKKRYGREAIEARIRQVMTDNPGMFGFVIAFKPWAFEPETRLYAPYICRKKGQLEFSLLEDTYDYTRENTAGLNWYIKPMNRGKGWSEPYFGTVSDELLAVYSVPFIAPGETQGYTGVVTAVYSLENIRGIMNHLNLDSKGFGYLISKKGVLISHPDRQVVEAQRKAADILAEKGLDKDEIERIMAGKGEVVDFKDNTTSRNCIAVTLTVPSTGYLLGTAFNLDLMVNDENYFRRRVMEITISLTLGSICLCVFLAANQRRSNAHLWMASVFISLVLTVAIGFTWVLALRHTPYSRPGTVVIYDHASLKGFINSWKHRPSNGHGNKSITIPTGVFVQSLEFNSTNNVLVTGNIWQRYDKTVPPRVTRGFILPEAVDASITEVFRKKDAAGETIGWHFQATLRQEFDYSRYPLDNKDMWLRLRPADFDQPILLTPDLNAYKLRDPKSLPGVEDDIVMAQWNAKESFFSYVTNAYNTYFGMASDCTVGHSPELYFTIIIARCFINPFVNNLLPFLVISSILFCTQLLVYVSRENVQRFNISVGEFLAACSGLLFSVLIAHNGLRSSISASGFLYLENVYFILYGAIVIVMLNTFCVAFGIRSSLIAYRDNLIIKLLFWPVILGIMLFKTAYRFY